MPYQSEQKLEKTLIEKVIAFNKYKTVNRVNFWLTLA